MENGPFLALSSASPCGPWRWSSATCSSGGPQVGRVDDPLELRKHRRLGLGQESHHSGVIHDPSQIANHDDEIQHVLAVLLLHQS